MSDPVTPEDGDPFHGNPPSDLLRGAMGGGGSPPPESLTGWQPPEPEDLARLLPQYAISHLIGRGGMGVVYQGVQLSLRRDVAIKLLPPELGASPEFEARFRREAMAMARLNHPNIVQIHDYGQTAEGHHYIVMEYVDGTNLRHIIREGGLDAVEALRAVSQICDALEYAHAEGFVHRDIKPTNIFISRKGGLKIGDFGLVKLVGDEARTELGEEDVTLTDMVMGTPHYIAPEQWGGLDSVDRRADIYSLGVMFYEMLTGTVPKGAFRAPSERVEALDVRIDGVVYRAMQEDPDDRYQSAADLRTDVECIRTTPAAETGKGDPGPRRKAPSRIGVSAVVLGLAAVAALAGWWVLREGSAGTPARNESGASAEEGDWISLLPFVDPTADAVKGSWVRVADGIQGANPDRQPGPTLLSLPYEPPEEYDFRIAFTTFEGNCEAVQMLSAFGRRFAWATASGQSEKWAGFDVIDGKTIFERAKHSPDGKATAAVKLPTRPSVGVRHESLVEVRHGRVTAYVNGQKLVDWPTDYQEMGIVPDFALPNPRALGVGLWWSRSTFHDISVREVTGKGKLLREGSAGTPARNESGVGASPGGVADFVPLLDKDHMDGWEECGTPGEAVLRDGVLSISHERQFQGYFWYRPKTFSDFVLKFEYKLLTASANSGVAVRFSYPGNDPRIPGGNKGHYHIDVSADKDPLQVSGAIMFVKGPNIAPPQTIGEWNEMEISAVGQRYTVKINGKLVNEFTGSRATEGYIGFQVGRKKGMQISKVRIMDLAGGGAGAAPASEVHKPTPPPASEADKSVRAPIGDPSQASKEQPFENSLGMKFVPVPGTEVLFCIHETRWKDYAAYAKQAKGAVDGAWRNQTLDGFEIKRGGEDHPVAQVNWDDARRFCEWLSEKEGRTYRLPTDREWSLAVGIGDREEWKDGTTPATVFKVPDEFPWGSEWPPPVGAGNYSDQSRKEKVPRDGVNCVEGGYDDGFPTTAPVMSFAPNPFGLYDMGGNIYEWCEDWHSKEQVGRVIRGGSWNDRSGLLSSDRRRPAPEKRHYGHGFRLVLVADGGGKPTAPPAPGADKSVRAPDPPQATKARPFENSLGMKFVPVPGTDVLFCIHETRWKDYAAYAAENPGIDDGWRDQTTDGFTPTDRPGDHPVWMVDWGEAKKFCEWLSRKESKTYRLPTDEEWSVAVGLGRKELRSPGDTPRSLGGKVQGEYPWGTAWPPPAGAGNYSDQSRKAKAAPPRNGRFFEDYDDSFPTTAPVMSFASNAFGLHDLGGNVWEWVEDWYDERQESRLRRGGSWNNNTMDDLRSSHRYRDYPTVRRQIGGFRLVLVADGVSAPAQATTPPTPNPDKSVRAPIADPPQATKEQPFENSLGMKFVPVEGTKVLFCIHETRWRDYAVFAGETPGLDNGWRSQTEDGFTVTDRPGDHPARRINWVDAKAFCEWISRQEGRAYRLPTDEEWSIAVGLGSKEHRSPGDTPESLNGRVPDEYPWDAAWPPPAGASNFSDQSRKRKAPSLDPFYGYLEGYDDDFPTTAPVMSFPPNPFGLHDMEGNVREWVEDWFDAARERRLLRGGSWANHREHELRSSNRRSNPPEWRYPNSGFRLVLALDGDDNAADATGAVP